MNDDVRRVLVYRLGSLGDTLIALPSFHLIYLKWSGTLRLRSQRFADTPTRPYAGTLPYDPFHFEKRETEKMNLNGVDLGGEELIACRR